MEWILLLSIVFNVFTLVYLIFKEARKKQAMLELIKTAEFWNEFDEMFKKSFEDDSYPRGR